MCESLEDLYHDFGAESKAVQQIETFSTALKRRQVSGAQACAKATTEILRVVLGMTKLQTAEHMLAAVRVVGKELSRSAASELAVGNIARRVLHIIREEYSNKLRGSNGEGDGTSGDSSHAASDANTKEKKPRSGSLVEAMLASTSGNDIGFGNDMGDSSSSSGGRDGSGNRGFAEGTGGTRNGGADRHGMHQPSLGSVLGAWETATEYTNDEQSGHFAKYFPDMRQCVIGAVNELNDEIDNIFGPICEQAQEHIHAEQCILAYGWSQSVELFLKAAGRKRKYQVIVSEAAPDLSGHKLAQALSKVSNITVTVIPDSAIYAIMGRVNKVILSPHAVLADGGSMYTAGHLMVAVAAKEHNVPVVGLAAAFHLTPMFAHNQSETLGQLLSPSLIIQYNAAVCQENVEVVNPAFDFVPPNLMTLYVTNNGSHQPSYIHRLLAELYHPSDHGSLM